MKKIIKITCLLMIASLIGINSFVSNDFSTTKNRDKLSSLLLINQASAEDPNYVYLEKLVVSEVYDEIVRVEGGLKFWIKKVPLGYTIEANLGSGLVAEKKNCEAWALGRCDQNKVGIFPLNLN